MSPKNQESLLAQSSEHESSRSRLGLLATLGSGVLAASLLLSACASAKPVEVPSVSETIEPAPMETEIPIEEMVMPESLVKYESMPLAEFEALPVEERLSYVSWLTRDEQDIMDSWYGASEREEDKLSAPISINSSNQDIATAGAYSVRNAFTSHFLENGIDDSLVMYDLDTSLKILSAGWYDTSSATYAEWTLYLKDYYAKNPGATPKIFVKNDNALGASTATEDNPENYNLTIGDREFQARDVQAVTSIGGNSNITYVYIEYKNYENEITPEFIYSR